MIPIHLLFKDKDGHDLNFTIFAPDFLKHFELHDAFHCGFVGFTTKAPKRTTTAKSDRKLNPISERELAGIYKQIDSMTKVSDLF